ncbi:hypothetical protein DFH08DRAFT_973150 [Mycena albidolilacea]|uniref:Uncharacterized protein n=1 Tax=Mycena albidolilacea TaxID=1033008 RepID=A0AAD6Z9F7_9AGAR|nr:hypothetical protein DFH08DRAFT_973150 [Mycena albidolilacea]
MRLPPTSPQIAELGPCLLCADALCLGPVITSRLCPHPLRAPVPASCTPVRLLPAPQLLRWLPRLLHCSHACLPPSCGRCPGIPSRYAAFRTLCARGAAIPVAVPPSVPSVSPSHTHCPVPLPASSLYQPRAPFLHPCACCLAFRARFPHSSAPSSVPSSPPALCFPHLCLLHHPPRLPPAPLHPLSVLPCPFTAPCMAFHPVSVSWEHCSCSLYCTYFYIFC